MPLIFSQSISAENIENGNQLQSDTLLSKPSFWDGFLTPEGFVMFFFAVMIDIIEIVCDVFGVTFIVAVVLDIAAYIFISSWMIARGSNIKVSQKSVKTLTQTAQRIAKIEKRLKWVRVIAPLFELIPFVSIVPCWVAAVYFELKYGNQ